MPEQKTIKVRVAAHRKDDSRAILNDEDERHPKGHVLITGETAGAIEVGNTPRVREVIVAGDLDLVEEKKTDGAASKP